MTAHSRAVEVKTERPVLSEKRTSFFYLEKELKIKGWCQFYSIESCESWFATLWSRNEQENISEVVDLLYEFGQQQEHNTQLHRRRIDLFVV